MDEALKRLNLRMGHPDLDLLVTSVLIQRQSGGNLAEMMESIAATIKDRIRIKGEIKVLTASGRISGIIVGLLPVFILGILLLLNPHYVVRFLEEPAGRIMLIVAAILETIGWLTVKNIVDIRY